MSLILVSRLFGYARFYFDCHDATRSYRIHLCVCGMHLLSGFRIQEFKQNDFSSVGSVYASVWDYIQARTGLNKTDRNNFHLMDFCSVKVRVGRSRGVKRHEPI